MLEPGDGKLSRPVLRGERGRKAPALPGIIEYKDQIKDMIKRKGSEHAQEVADRMHTEGRLSGTAYDMITRLVRMDGVEDKGL